MLIKKKYEFKNGRVFREIVNYWESEEAYNNGELPIKVEEFFPDEIIDEMEKLSFETMMKAMFKQKVGEDYERE